MVKMPTLRELLDAGVHFGHKTSRWHPKMKPYIFMAKNGVHVINLEETEKELQTAVEFLKQSASLGKTIVFVGTKKQASQIVKKAAIACGMPYVDNRWVGGLITNFNTVKTAIENFKKEKQELETNGENLSKKELARLRGKVEKSEKIFGGLTNLSKKPDVLILIGAHDEEIAIKEARIEKVETVGITDTNTDPESVTYPIPANDDATKSLVLFSELFSKVILENKKSIKKEENEHKR